MIIARDGTSIRWVPTAVARRMLGVSKQRVYQLISAGKVASCIIEGAVMVSVESIESRKGKKSKEVRESGEIR